MRAKELGFVFDWMDVLLSKMNFIRFGLIACLLMAGSMLRAQSPTTQLDSPMHARNMLTPLPETKPAMAADLKSESARLPSTSSIVCVQDPQFKYEQIDYFNLDHVHPPIGSSNGNSICSELFNIEPFSDSKLPRDTYPEPKTDSITRRMEQPPIIIDGQVRPVGFQTPTTSKQDANTNSTQEVPAAKQEATDGGSTSPLIVNGMSIEGLRKKVKDQIELVKSNETLDETSKIEQLKQLESAKALVQKAATLTELIAAETRKKNEFETDKKALDAKLAETPPSQSPDTNKTSKQLQLELQEKRRLELAKQSERSSIDSQLEDRDKRITDLPGLRTAVQERQKQTKEQIAAIQSQPDDIASGFVLNARELAATLELNQIDIESARQDQLGILLPLQHTLLSREINILEMEIKAWEVAYDASRKREIDKQQEQALEAREIAIKADKALAELAIENEKLAQERSELTLKDHQCDERSAQTDARFNEIESSLASVQEKIETSGRMTREHGIELVELRPSLMHTFESQARIEQITMELQEYRVKGLSLKEESETFSTPDVLIENLVEQRSASNPVKTGPVLSDAEFEEMAKELIKTKLSYLRDLQNDYQTYRTNLTNERDRLVKLINKVREAFRYIDENALWVPSANPISLADLAKSKSAACSFFDSAQWIELVGYAKDRMVKRPYESALAGFIMLAIMVVTRRLKETA